ncbi:Chromodomain-helicase-DNA-binding protein 1 [Fasciola gigantica]|uniref:Chromodomain-helicase-DNA-binding protein 1 n=1 Tax=Fasciola gigantica TaxID=46835 RepID=A0A504Z004_FASGI|nr:Chromodomain-helicase-DNA-binding protein 1 [Fasciola gigantica]
MRLQNLLDSVRSLPTTENNVVTQSDLENAGLKDITLRAHQLYGVSWLKECVAQKRGGILCDEMGLGKTCQMIAFLTSVFQDVPETTALIVTPLSVIQNWKTELERFAPRIRYTQYLGDQTTRAEHRAAFSLEHTTVILTSFETALNDEEFLGKHRWDILVVDEGHRLKNSESLLYGALEDICRGLRFILSGTPVQNSLVELYNLLHFVAPKYFPMNTRSEFVNYFDSDTDESGDRADTMNQLIHPFLLRRTKRQVLPDLPPRLDLLLYHPLSRIQTELYRALLTRNADVLTAVISSVTRSTAPTNRVLNTIMQLRKCVDHPYLFNGVEPEPFELGQHLINASGKLVLLDALLSHLFNPWHADPDYNDARRMKIQPPVHKVLIFSQMTRMLDIIQDYLTLKDSANTVRSFVSLLNGRPVRVIRLVGRNTVEEAILARADTKLKLTAEVLGSADTALVAGDTHTTSGEEVIHCTGFYNTSLSLS